MVGCAVARELARFRVRVLLLEASDDVGTGATKANSGIVHGAYSSPHGTLKSALCAAGNRMYRRLDEELRFGWRRTGALVLAFSPREEEGLRALYGNGLRAGDRDLELLDGARARALEPALGGGVTAALLAPSVGVASPYELAIALAENAVENGVELRLSAPVTAIRRHAGAASGFTLVAGGSRCGCASWSTPPGCTPPRWRPWPASRASGSSPGRGSTCSSRGAAARWWAG